MDETAYLQVVEQRGVPAVMWNTDVRRYGPKSYISSIVVDWSKYYVGQMQARLEGNWMPGQQTLLDMGENVPSPIRAQADAIRTKMLAGYTPFIGEIKDASDKVRIPVRDHHRAGLRGPGAQLAGAAGFPVHAALSRHDRLHIRPGPAGRDEAAAAGAGGAGRALFP